MEVYSGIYRIYTSAPVFVLRLVIFAVLVYSVLASAVSLEFPKFSLFLLNIFIMTEIFFHFKILRVLPRMKVADAQEPKDALTLKATSIMQSLPAPKFFPKAVSHNPEIRFLLVKLGIEKSEFPQADTAWQDVIIRAQDLAKKLNGQYITSGDLLIAYLFLAEEKSKVLFEKKLKEEDVLSILHWARIEFPKEDGLYHHELHAAGGGIAEGLITGWTPETQKYTSNYTYSLRKRPLLIGREHEYEAITTALAKSEGNDVLVTGEVGSGRENLIQALAYDSYKGTLHNNLNFKIVLELMVGQLIAGASQRGDLETRLQAIIDEVSHSGNVILYIPELQNIMGAGSYQIDLSGALLPYLKNGKLPIIASVTSGNFKAYMEKSPLKEAFTVLPIDEPDRQAALLMLMEKAAEIESQERVLLTYRAIMTAVAHADRYMQDEVLPGSGVRLLIDASHEVVAKRGKGQLVTDEDVISKVEEITKIKIAQPQGSEKELLLDLEKRLHERIIGQDVAVSSIAEAIRRLRTGVQQTTRPISFLFLGPTGVGKTETAKALGDLYFGGESNSIRLDMSEYANESGLARLLGALPGQGDERGELTDKIHDHPASLVLLDEFEKAHPRILDLFLQVLEDGRLTDNKGKTVSFSNAIIIATSNAGSELIRESVKSGKPIDKAFEASLIENLQSNRIFKPELLNRFDDVVTFKPLSKENIQAIIKLELNKLIKALEAEDIKVSFDDTVIAKIAEEGIDDQFGARPLRRYIQNTIEDLIAKKKLKDEIGRGDKIQIGVDQSNNLQLTGT